MDNETSTPTQEATEDLEAAAREESEAVAEVVEEIVEEVAEEVHESAETAQEAATEAAETVEEEVEAAVEAHPSLDPAVHGDEVYNHVLQRLREDGHLPSDAVAEEVAGEAEHAVEVVEEAPAAVVEETPAVTRDEIRPTSEHFWYRPRRIFGRSI